MKPEPRWKLREATIADRDSILALRKLVFAVEDPEKQDPAFWTWEFMDGPEGRARIFVAVDGDKVVGHYAMIPQDFKLAGDACKGSIIVDLMTHPDYRRQGIFARIARFAFDTASDQLEFASAYPIRKESSAGFLALGWVEQFKIPVLVRPLSWPAIARRFLFSLGDLPAWVAGPWRALRALFAPSLRAGETLRDLQSHECQQLAEVAASGILGVDAYRVRSAEFFRWRFFASPAWKYRISGLFREGRLQAYVVSRQAKLLDTASLAIVDLGGLPGTGRELSILINELVRQGTASGQAVAGAMVTPGNRYHRALRGAGFYPGPHKFSLVLSSNSETFWQQVPPGASWYLSWADTDGV